MWSCDEFRFENVIVTCGCKQRDEKKMAVKVKRGVCILVRIVDDIQRRATRKKLISRTGRRQWRNELKNWRELWKRARYKRRGSQREVQGCTHSIISKKIFAYARCVLHAKCRLRIINISANICK